MPGSHCRVLPGLGCVGKAAAWPPAPTLVCPTDNVQQEIQLEAWLANQKQQLEAGVGVPAVDKIENSSCKSSYWKLLCLSSLLLRNSLSASRPLMQWLIHRSPVTLCFFLFLPPKTVDLPSTAGYVGANSLLRHYYRKKKEFKYNPIGLSLQEELGPWGTAFLGISASSTVFWY